MLVDIPEKWSEYFFHDDEHEPKTFRKDTPKDIIDKAKELNKELIRLSGHTFFHFDEVENA